MTNSAARFLRDESGASSVEYALIAAGMAAAVMAAVAILSDALSAWAQSLAAVLGIS
jgi:pilus assembly protein Flp/PilA